MINGLKCDTETNTPTPYSVHSSHTELSGIIEMSLYLMNFIAAPVGSQDDGNGK